MYLQHFVSEIYKIKMSDHVNVLSPYFMHTTHSCLLFLIKEFKIDMVLRELNEMLDVYL